MDREVLRVLGELATAAGGPLDAARIAGAAAVLDAKAPELAGRLRAARTSAEVAVVAARAMRELARAVPAATDAGVQGGGQPGVAAQRPGTHGSEIKPPRATGTERARKARMNERREAAKKAKQEKHLAADRAGGLAVGDRPVESLKGIGPAAGRALRTRGVETLGDLAMVLPRRYEDERVVTPIGSLEIGRRQVTVGIVSHVSAGYGRRSRVEVTLEPEAPERGAKYGLVRLVWFNAPPGIGQRFERGQRWRVAGMVEEFRGALSMAHPETARLDGPDAMPAVGIVPRYPEVQGVAPRMLARAARAAAEVAASGLSDVVPQAVREAEGFGTMGEAVLALHTPPPDLDEEALAAWNDGRTPHHARLAFEEFFLLELALHRRRVEEAGLHAEALVPRAGVERGYRDAGRAAAAGPLERARGALPFQLTGAQARAVAEIGADLSSERPMRRLLQGDVGSGKTAVALLAAAHAVAAGAQVAFMAPTELLAEQHFRSLAPFGRALGLRVELVVGGARASHRKKLREGLAAGTIDVAVGTHALLTEGVVFRKLRLAIVDEQHRFGVGQRLRLVEKTREDGVAPHLLVMTATPIPRTLALALYGDLDATVIDEMPPGRIPPVTKAYGSSRRDEVLGILDRAIAKNGQVYVVCPLVEESEDSDLRDAVSTHVELSKRFAPHGVALVHGRLEADERQEAMAKFARGEARVLVATTVIEVGVDVPAANAIMIEHAERFGLAQLHQLRGRIGRGGQPSACLLLHDAYGEEAVARLRVMCETNDGFRIAEEDLKLRGPGELFGRKQSGLPGFRFADLRRDLELLSRARDAAKKMMEDDPGLELEEHFGARQALEKLAASPRGLVKEEAG